MHSLDRILGPVSLIKYIMEVLVNPNSFLNFLHFSMFMSTTFINSQSGLMKLSSQTITIFLLIFSHQYSATQHDVLGLIGRLITTLAGQGEVHYSLDMGMFVIGLVISQSFMHWNIFQKSLGKGFGVGHPLECIWVGHIMINEIFFHIAFKNLDLLIVQCVQQHNYLQLVVDGVFYFLP